VTQLSELGIRLETFSPVVYSATQLTRWWCALNRSEWPEDFPCREPAVLRQETLWAHMTLIEAHLGRRKCLAQWNAERGVHAKEFNEWWERRGRALLGVRFFAKGGTTL